ncbi:hypothetical protein DICSQDRAFT_174142 [Dichomitus squalens LYAD-421 SS1]|uniref:DUF6533 domain-containing protein n=1 Tax=Dichomitus squalens (strain LYAD-421) TaxID=732165 RepID=R7SM42_DICSQ|nr:uncharacterized protein DICSQDRAFT_174142 [Dichomitus squalens LYAD-421 SS1]EJF57186.1 hypothetical protein DICSQDRAFT_174142 [Dichomitus squalens LYAD-421 SS1]
MTYTPSTTVEIFRALRIENYCLVAANVLYVYDYFITLGVEVEFFWNRSFSGAVLLFVGNRYLTLVNVVTDYLQLLPLSAFSGNKRYYLS